VALLRERFVDNDQVLLVFTDRIGGAVADPRAMLVGTV
jgi:hypothetical protein